MHVNETGASGVDYSAILDVWDDSTSAIKGYIHIRDVTETNYKIFRIISAADFGVYRRFTGAQIAASGAFTADMPVRLLFSQTGDQGIQGPAGATGSTGPAGPGLPPGGTAGQVPAKVDATDFNTAWKTLAKGDVGLGNVDNTSDANKPISTATQTALDGKADVADYPRTRVTSNFNVYVRPDGNDSNSGLTDNAAGAYLTLQGCLNDLFASYDFAGRTIFVNVRAGTYAGFNLNLGHDWVGAGAVILQADAGVTISSSATCMTFGNDFRGGSITISGFTLTASAGGLIFHSGQGLITIGAGMTYGSATGDHISASGPVASITVSQPYNISGGGSSHFNAGVYGAIRCVGIAATLSGTPAFTFAYARSDRHGILQVPGSTFLGTGATGPRYYAKDNGVISGPTSETFFPGSTAGTRDTGGVYGSFVNYQAVIGSFAAKSSGTQATTHNVDTKVNITVESVDKGNYYAAASSRWTPPAGAIAMAAGLQVTSQLNVNDQCTISIYKNGVSLLNSFSYAPVANFNPQPKISFSDIANGTDYYEIWFGVYGSSNVNAKNVQAAWFNGISFGALTIP